MKYDAIIIGAGIGGMFCANYLARKNKKVLLLEQHITPGGYICGFRRGKYYFDGANNSFSSHGTIFPLLKELGLDQKLTFHKHRMSHRVASANLYIKYDSFENFKQAIIKAFPYEMKINEFLKILEDFYQFFNIIEKINNPMMYAGTQKISCMMKYIKIMFKKETRKCLGSIIKYGLLSSGEFAGRFFDEDAEAYKFFRMYGNPNQSAIVLGAMISEFINDKWYPDRGEQNFAGFLIENAQSYGAEIKYSTKVKEIITRNGRAIGVRTDNSVFEASNIIIGCDYRKSLLEMLDNQALIGGRFRKRLLKAENSESLFTVYLGLKCEASLIENSLNGNRMNYTAKIVIKETGECRNEDYFKDVTISLFSASVISSGTNHDGYSSLTIQCLCPARWMNNWGDGDKNQYKKLKQKVQEQLLGLFAAAVPELYDKIDFIESATPRTYERYTNNSDGAYCAWSWEPGKSFFKDLKIHVTTPVRNLFCCSDWCYKIGGMVSPMLGAKRISTHYIK